MIIFNQSFFVTGAASGLGYAVAQMIVENGGRVLLADINTEAGARVEAELGSNAKFVTTNVVDELSVKNALNIGLENFGHFSGVVNCAGIGPAERVLGRQGLHSLEIFNKVIQVNLIGAFNVIRLLTEQMQNNPLGVSGERGVIINTASVAAFEGQIGQAAYAASKGGIVAMTLPLAREFARIGVRVMTIAPGIFETPLLVNLSDEARTSLGQQVPFPARLGQASEYAALVKHIIENQMLNGEVIRLDGAIRMAAK